MAPGQAQSGAAADSGLGRDGPACCDELGTAGGEAFMARQCSERAAGASGKGHSSKQAGPVAEAPG
jgi:hypothetical protein